MAYLQQPLLISDHQTSLSLFLSLLSHSLSLWSKDSKEEKNVRASFSGIIAKDSKEESVRGFCNIAVKASKTIFQTNLQQRLPRLCIDTIRRNRSDQDFSHLISGFSRRNTEKMKT